MAMTRDSADGIRLPTARKESDMLERVLDYALKNEAVRAVILEGSRTNIHIPPDTFQDYDITFLVTDAAPFIASDAWLSAFGKIIMMQKPEDMELFPPEMPGYSYLMLFSDYAKMDLTLMPLSQAEDYFQSDKLMQVLLDKDALCPPLIPTDSDYHIQRPTSRMADDCCNEFWMTTTYVVKGLCRGEILFAIDHLQIVRQELLRMLSWQVGMEHGFNFSLGKNYKFLQAYIPSDQWERLLCTYRMDSYAHMWEALFLCHALFREVSGRVCHFAACPYPDYDAAISRYTQDMYQLYKPE